MEARRSGRSSRGRPGPRRHRPGDVFIQVATDDPDARVRRAAVVRLSDPDTLAAVSRNDAETGGPRRRRGAAGGAGRQSADDDVGARRHRARRARPHARAGHAGPFVGARGVAARGRGAARPSRRRWAASPGTPLDAGTRLLALERLTDAAELEAVAINGEHADAAVAALDRLAVAVGRTAHRPSPSAPAPRPSAKRAKALLAGEDAAPAAGRAAPRSNTRTPTRTPRGRWSLRWRRSSASADAAAVRDGYAAARGRLGRTAGRRRGAAGDRRGVRDAVGSRPRPRWPPTRPRRADEARQAAGAAPGAGRAAGRCASASRR